MTGYQYRDPQRRAPAEAIHQELTEARKRASRAERQLTRQRQQLEGVQLRIREAEGQRKAYDKTLAELREERDRWRRKADSLATGPGGAIPDSDLVAHDRMIQRCRCGSWVYGSNRCSYCAPRHPGNY